MGTVATTASVNDINKITGLQSTAAEIDALIQNIESKISTSNSSLLNNQILNGEILDAFNNGGGVINLPSGTFNIDGNVELKSGVSIIGKTPMLEFYQNCPGLNHNQVGGTILVGSGIGSGALFTGQSTIGDTGPVGGPTPTFPSLDTDGIGMISVKHLSIQNFDYGFYVGAKNTNGMAFCDITNIHFKDIYQWAVRLTNPQHVALDRLVGFNVYRGVWFEADNSYCAPGISYLTRSFFYLKSVGAGEDYAKRYGVYITCDSDLVDQAFQMDGIRIHDSQINMYSAIPVADSVHIYAKGIDSNRCVTSTQVRNTLLDGRCTNAVVMENSFNSNIEIVHHPATIDGDSKIKLINGRQATIESRHRNTVINADANTTPFFLIGFIKNFYAGSRIAVGNYMLVDSNRTFITGRSTSTGISIDANTDAIGLSKFDPSNVATPKTTWPVFITKLSYSDQSATTVSMVNERSGIWKATNSSNSVWTLPSSPIDGMEYVIIKKSGAGNITLDAGTGKTIGFIAQTYVISATIGSSLYVLYDASSLNWHILGKN